MGETDEEVVDALAQLHDAGCELITITQYLRPSLRHHPIDRWVEPDQFAEFGRQAMAMGYSGVMSGPLVRSSYRAGLLYRQAMEVRSGTAAPEPMLAGMGADLRPRAGGVGEGATEALTHGFCLCSCISRYIVFL